MRSGETSVLGQVALNLPNLIPRARSCSKVACLFESPSHRKADKPDNSCATLRQPEPFLTARSRVIILVEGVNKREE
jgi:hypothetical protein